MMYRVRIRAKFAAMLVLGGLCTPILGLPAPARYHHEPHEHRTPDAHDVDSRSTPVPPPAASTDASLLTTAEQTDFAHTARHADVVALLDRLAARFPLARRVSMGRTFEDRDIPMLVIADPPISSPDEARRAAGESGKIVVLAIGNIHAGEVDGKEALPMLARRILERPDASEHRAVLNRLILVFAPIYNADGNERVAKGNRGTQNGPEETGIRENAQGFDLNRDFVKLEAPETRALVRAFNEWDPAVFIDCHITNGSYHRYVITYAGPKAPAGDQRVIDFSRTVLLPEVARDFEARTDWATFWYGNFNGEWGEMNEVRSRWETFPAEARYGTNYVGIRNRLSLLVETYTYAPFRERVEATVEYVHAALNASASHAPAIRELIARIDAEESETPAGVRPEDARTVAIRSRVAPRPGKHRIAGYVEETRDGRRHPTARHAEYEVELWDRFEPSHSVSRPIGYVVPARFPAVIENLRLHGIAVQPITEPRTYDAEVSTIESTSSASRAFQGHVIVRAEANTRREERTTEVGAFFVPTAQPLGRLAVYLLEPMCEDGLTAWNFFDAELNAGAEFPVTRVMRWK
jgi:dipeptidyl-peptidase 4